MTSNVKLTYYQRNKEKLLSYSCNSYNNNKDTLKQKRDNLPQEKKDIIRNYQKEWHDNNNMKEYCKNWYYNLSEENKNKKREYARNRYHTIIKVR